MGDEHPQITQIALMGICRRQLAAMPPDVRKGFAFPKALLFLFGLCPLMGEAHL